MSPFDQLLGMVRRRLPRSGGARTYVAGKLITDVRQVDDLLGTKGHGDGDEDEAAAGDMAEAARLKKEVERARCAARYQRDKACPAKMAKRKAWLDANRDKVRAYTKAYNKLHQKRMRAQQAAYQVRHYRSNPEQARAKARDYYARNREKLLARIAAKAAARKAARETAMTAAKPSGGQP